MTLCLPICLEWRLETILETHSENQQYIENNLCVLHILDHIRKQNLNPC